MTNRYVNREPGVRGVEHQIVFARFDRRRFQFCQRLFGGLRGVFGHVVGIVIADQTVWQDQFAVAFKIFVAHAHRCGQTVAAAEFAGRLVDRRHGEGRPDAVYVLVDVGTVGGSEIFLFVHYEQHGIDEVGTGRHCSGVYAQQQIGFFLDRHFHRVFLDRRGPGNFTRTLHGSQLHRLRLRGRVRLRNRDGLLGGGGNAGIAQVAGGGEAPGAVRNDANACADGFGIDDVLHLVFTRDHELPQIAADTHVAIGGAGTGRGIERDVGQHFLATDIHFREKHFGSYRIAETGNHQAAQANA